MKSSTHAKSQMDNKRNLIILMWRFNDATDLLCQFWDNEPPNATDVQPDLKKKKKKKLFLYAIS